MIDLRAFLSYKRESHNSDYVAIPITYRNDATSYLVREHSGKSLPKAAKAIVARVQLREMRPDAVAEILPFLAVLVGSESALSRCSGDTRRGSVGSTKISNQPSAVSFPAPSS